MNVGVIIAHLTFGTGPGSDFPIMHSTFAFPSLELCEAWKARMSTDIPQECRELSIIDPKNRPRQ